MASGIEKKFSQAARPWNAFSQPIANGTNISGERFAWGQSIGWMNTAPIKAEAARA